MDRPWGPQYGRSSPATAEEEGVHRIGLGLLAWVPFDARSRMRMSGRGFGSCRGEVVVDAGSAKVTQTDDARLGHRWGWC